MSESIKNKPKSFLSSLFAKEGTFAKGICFKRLLFIFLIGCIIGTYYEQILNLVTCYLEDGSIVWESRRGLIYGPLSPIYGAGYVIMVSLLARKDHKWYELIFYGALIGGGFEYLISLLQETFIGTISWDYSTYLLNIHGRTTIPYMIVWGLFCFVVIKEVYPLCSKMIESIPVKLGNLLTRFLIVFLALDMIVSFGALFRQTLRRSNIPPYTPVGEFFDNYYTDEYLKIFYANMKVSDKK